MTTSVFGSHVLNIEELKKRLPRPTYHALLATTEKGTDLESSHADVIAQTMMAWAQERGASHYTHWFQPMTGLTAQKHDAFLSFDSQKKPIERFSGAQLIQSEPDASSFPSGGMRTTFEARGYTAWDPSSPVFITTFGDVPVLCIPSVFFSYTGHALDKKTPLLRAMKVLNQTAAQAYELLTGKQTTITATVGFEQEYFLVDRELFNQRPDLIMAGRSLIGASPAKHQQMDDHYFGSIKDRVLAFMADLEKTLYQLGVPCKTRHNEVAPHQFEMAPIFEDANIAADHNQLVMDTLGRVAAQHHLAALLNEKPFAEVNGSGKHVNWSMETGDGANLLEPGQEPHANLVFLYFLVAVIKGVHKRGGFLRSTIATPGNDHRLGANEAPPAIMSVFLGEHMTDILTKIEASGHLSSADVASIDLGLAELPEIARDTTDRNRTSPFAFTGNKFEFRACGSSQSISEPVSAINVAVAEALQEMNQKLAELKVIDDKTVFEMLRPFIVESKAIRFEGNNYGQAWREEAAKRGLPNLPSTPEAQIHVWEDKAFRDFIIQIGLHTDQEIEARFNVNLEHYNNVLNIESSLLKRMVNTHVLPAVYRYQSEVGSSLQALLANVQDLNMKGLEQTIARQQAHLAALSGRLGSLLEQQQKLEEALSAVHQQPSLKEEALFYVKTIKPAMEAVRAECDQLENMIDAELWPLPSYHELLFIM